MSLADETRFDGESASITDGRRIVWAPQPGPQRLLLQCGTGDVLFGGARGVGKSDALLGDALKHAVLHPQHCNAVLFRKTYKQLDDLIRRSLEIYPQVGAKFNASDFVWRLPKGALIRFRYLDTDADAEELQGHNINYLGFDEAGNWPSSRGIDRLWGTLRSAHGVPTFRRLTGNPGGPGTLWLRKRYVEGHEPYVPFTYLPNDYSDLKIEAMYIPAKLEDNRILLESDPEYESRLAAVGDPDLWRAWRYGDWYVLKGAYFTGFDERIHIYDDAALEYFYPRHMSIDWGFNHPSACLWYATDGETLWVEREYLANKLTPIQLAERIVGLNNGAKLEAIYLSHDAFARRTSERTVASDMGDVFRANGLPLPTSSDRDRKGSLMVVQHRLATGTLKIHRSCKSLIDNIRLAQRDEDDPEDCLKADGDDALDSLLYGVKRNGDKVRIPEEVQIRRQLTGKTPHDLQMQERIIRARLRDGNSAGVPRSSGPRWTRSWQGG